MGAVISSQDSCFHNINTISQNANRRAEAFHIVEKGSQYVIETNGLLGELFLRVRHAVWGGGDSYRQKLHDVIEADVKVLNEAQETSYVNREGQIYTEVFLAAQRYNHAVNMYMGQDQDLKDEVPLFEDLSLKALILPRNNYFETLPVKLKADKIEQSCMENIPEEQQPHIYPEGWWHKHNVYHYNEADTKISHGQEAARIFLSTQRERLKSCVGGIIEAAAGVFGRKTTAFSEDHYFRKGEDKGGEIYAQDAPLSTTEKSTSYWVGHATCLFSVSLQSKDKKTIKVNIITDPVEGDLNTLLYPRMTQPARSVDACPVPHIYLLSHNHLDHYNEETIKKLRKYQPIMIVPEEDADKFRKLGFKHIYENNWWQTTTIPIEQGGQQAEIKITAVPANHWSGQGPCDGHQAAFVGYVIHKDEGDIYFAGDTARLSKEHIATLRERFNIRSMFQPGGPDDVREDMQSTHQASVDGLWMHFNLMIRNLYNKGNYSDKSKEDFIQEAKKLRTVYMHTKTYKLGNLHFDDTDESIKRVKKALEPRKHVKKPLKSKKRIEGERKHGKQAHHALRGYEKRVHDELLDIGKNLKFQGNNHLEAKDILEILNGGVIVPKIGSRTELAS
jgi:L-ascorbate metabolism protein UlaG (beta-lactamase superfamily)